MINSSGDVHVKLLATAVDVTLKRYRGWDSQERKECYVNLFEITLGIHCPWRQWARIVQHFFDQCSLWELLLLLANICCILVRTLGRACSHHWSHAFLLVWSSPQWGRTILVDSCVSAVLDDKLKQLKIGCLLAIINSSSTSDNSSKNVLMSDFGRR